MYSQTTEFDRITLELQNVNFQLGVSGQKWTNLCKGKMGTKKIIEAFQDNMGKEAKAAGPIFCEPLNGRMIEFPETTEKFEELRTFQVSTMRKKKLNEMSMTVNAKSFASVGVKPYISKSAGGTMKLLSIDNAKPLKPSEEVLKYISLNQQSYQSSEELCYIMTTKIHENSTPSVFTNQMCNGYGGWWTVCEFDKTIFVSISGLCSTSPMDKIYTLVEPKEDRKDRHGTFVGNTGWVLEYNENMYTWKITHYAYQENEMVLIGSNRRPFGKQPWLVKKYLCTQGEDATLELLLSNCDSDQFTCNDGSCVPLQSRCDKKQNCRDLSDEKECQIVALDKERYLKDDTPPPLTAGKRLEVILSVDVQNILDIQEVQKILSLKLDLQESWNDSRLQYYNLKEDEDLNTLFFSEKQQVWVPRILFSNTREDFTSKNDKQAFAKVIRSSKGSLVSLETSEDILVYKGSENEVRINRVYEVDFICDYDMRFYPFDIQVCTVDLIIDGNTAKFIDLVPGKLLYSGSTDLAQYYVMSYEIYSKDIKGKGGVQISITMGRRLLGTVLTVYVPTVLLNVIGHSTNYFKDFFFEAVVSINLTCMLVLVTLFISVSDSLPKTSYIKMMDVWLIFNLILPFVEVLLHTYMESLNEDDITKLKKDPESEKVLQCFIYLLVRAKCVRQSFMYL